MSDITDAEFATKLLPHLVAFAAVMESGSFTAAGRRLGVDKTLVSRRVTTLESRLHARLLHRTTRSVSPTELGQRLYDQTRKPLGDTITAVLAAGAQQIEGRVRVATFVAVGAELWGDVITTMRRRHPRVSIELCGADTYVGMVEQGVDVALRSGHMPDSSMISRRIGTWGFVLCASRGWLERNGDRIRHPNDTRCDWLLYRGISRADSWSFVSGNHRCELRLQPQVSVDSFELQRQLVASGVGIAALPAMAARVALASGQLVRVLPNWRVEHTHGLWVVLPTRAHTPSRVNALITAVEQRVRQLQPLWDATREVQL